MADSSKIDPPSPTIARMLWRDLNLLGGDAWRFCGKGAGWLWGSPRGCWVSVNWGFTEPKELLGDGKGRSPRMMRFLLRNRSAFPVVAVEAGWVFRSSQSKREERFVPLLGAAIGDPILQVIDAKSREYLTLDVRLIYPRLKAEFEDEPLGGEDLLKEPGKLPGAYVRLENGRVFRSYHFF